MRFQHQIEVCYPLAKEFMIEKFGFDRGRLTIIRDAKFEYTDAEGDHSEHVWEVGIAVDMTTVKVVGRGPYHRGPILACLRSGIQIPEQYVRDARISLDEIVGQ